MGLLKWGCFPDFSVEFPSAAGNLLELQHCAHERQINALLFDASSKAMQGRMQYLRGISDPEPDKSENTPWGLALELATA